MASPTPLDVQKLTHRIEDLELSLKELVQAVYLLPTWSERVSAAITEAEKTLRPPTPPGSPR